VGWHKTKSPDSSQNQGSTLRLAATYSPTKIAVPSAQTGLTSLFGMGRGGTFLNNFQIIIKNHNFVKKNDYE